MTFVKKISSILIAVLLFVSVSAGCAKDESTEKTTVSSERSTVKPEETTTEAETTIADISGLVNAKAKAGDIVRFGKYEQDNIVINGQEEIRWWILAVENGKALLISEQVLDTKPFNEINMEITWETCTLRLWLNDDFYNRAFSENDQNKIETTNVLNGIDQKTEMGSGNNTKDKVFLLSEEEVQNYLKNREMLKTRGTDLAKGSGLFTGNDGSDASIWWLRSLYSSPEFAKVVNFDGRIITNGVLDTKVGVRPAVWVNLAADE